MTNLSISSIQDSNLILIQVVGNSMLPSIHPGNELLAKPVSKIQDLQLGDILIYQLPENSFPIAHRVIHVNPSHSQVITSSDHWPHLKTTVPEKCFLGKVFAVKKNNQLQTGKRLTFSNWKAWLFIHYTYPLKVVLSSFVFSLLTPFQSLPIYSIIVSFFHRYSIILTRTTLTEKGWLIALEKPDRTLIGSAEIMVQNSQALIYNLQVRIRYRGLGYGALIVQRCLEHMRKKSIRKIYASTAAKNVPAKRVFDRMDFRPFSQAESFPWQHQKETVSVYWVFGS